MERRHIPIKFDVRDGNRMVELTREQMLQRRARQEIYGRTEPHADLDDFDARGMDSVEGRT